jgi:peptidylprolyl isomerase
MSKSFKSIVFAASALLAASFGPALAGDPENTLIMELPAGKVVIELAPELAPKHVARVKELTRKGFYDGTPFHRVIDKFMAQGGDPTGTGTGGSGVKIPAEFSGEPFVRGVVGMARSADPNSADSQFFIMLGSAPSLDGRYTAIGKVTDGMAAVDRIKKGDPAANGMVTKPDTLVRMQVAADVKQ